MKWGCTPDTLPKSVEAEDIMVANEIERLLQNHFTYKYLASEYDIDLPDQLYEQEGIIAEIIRLTAK